MWLPRLPGQLRLFWRAVARHEGDENDDERGGAAFSNAVWRGHTYKRDRFRRLSSQSSPIAARRGTLLGVRGATRKALRALSFPRRRLWSVLLAVLLTVYVANSAYVFGYLKSHPYELHSVVLRRSDNEWRHSRSVGESPFSRGDVGLWLPPLSRQLGLDEVREYYVALARAYLAPFRDGVRRELFFDLLKRKNYGVTPPGASKGTQCVLVQIVSNRVYMFDPYNVRLSEKPFTRSRMQQVIYLLSRLAVQRRLPDSEFVLAVHDCVQTVSTAHTYRAARYVEDNPAFTIVGCSFSNNIPFPMWEDDDARGGCYRSWDAQMRAYAEDAYEWPSKLEQAVFRGGLRLSALYLNKSDAERNCEQSGRGILVRLARQHPQLFNVSVSGSCAGRLHRLSRLDPHEHHRFKYVLYAEGNCFWADRLSRQLFGPSVVVKQETPCGQFFEPLLRPYTHYLPTDLLFSDLTEQLEWIKGNDARAREMVRQANLFAKSFLSVDGIAAYVEVLLNLYSTLLVEETVRVEAGAIDVTMTDV